MGQKVSPHGLRVGVIKDWGSKWYADKNSFSDSLVEDNQIRKFVKKKLYAAGVSNIVIERRTENEMRIIIIYSPFHFNVCVIMHYMFNFIFYYTYSASSLTRCASGSPNATNILWNKGIVITAASIPCKVGIPMLYFPVK